MSPKGNEAQSSNRAAELTALLADAPEATDHEAVGKYIHRLAEAGCSVLFILPGSKLPADMRSPAKRRADDKAAAEAAREAGRRDWHHVRSPAGLALATTDSAILDGYLTRYVRHYSAWSVVTADGTPGERVSYSKEAEDAGDIVMTGPVAVNLAVEVGGSGLVVVDCDTAGQTARFVAEVGLDPDSAEAAPTVRSPGHRGEGADPDDPSTWAHSDGGHWWFTVPEGVALPAGSGSGATTLGGGEGFAVLWNRRYVLIPPSVRPEGGYAVGDGKVGDLPPWLADSIAKAANLRAERADRSREAMSGGDAVSRWGAQTTWAEILQDTEWTNTGKPDGCGCEVWTAPGVHASPKSATAHEPGCAGEGSDDPCLHVWTDHDIEPFGPMVDRHGPHLTRLRAVTAIHYNNDLGAAMTDLSDAYDQLALDDAEVVFLDEYRKAESDGDGGTDTRSAGVGRSLHITWACEIEPEPVDWLWVDISMRNTAQLVPEGATAPDPFRVDDIACVAPGHTWSAPEVETDGRIACGMVSIAAGREGSGKSSFGIWLAAKITCGELPGSHYGSPKRVYYLATEDSWKHTLVPRLIAAGADLSMVARIEVAVSESATVTLSLPDDVDLLTQSILDNDVALVVIDPLMSTMSAGLDTNGTRDVRTALEPLAAMADKTGAAVVALAHFNKATGLDSLTRITGSGAFKDVARAVMVFAVDTDGERVFSQPKNSVGRNDLPSLKYEVTGAVVETRKGKAATARFRFSWTAESTVDEVLVDQRRGGHRVSPVQEFLVGYLTEHADKESGEVDAADVIAAGEGEGHTRRQITDARARCAHPKIATRSEGFGKDKRHLWKIA